MPLNVRTEDSRSFTKTIFLEGSLDTDTVSTFDQELDAVLDVHTRITASQRPSTFSMSSWLGWRDRMPRTSSQTLPTPSRSALSRSAGEVSRHEWLTSN